MIFAAASVPEPMHAATPIPSSAAPQSASLGMAATCPHPSYQLAMADLILRKGATPALYVARQQHRLLPTWRAVRFGERPGEQRAIIDLQEVFLTQPSHAGVRPRSQVPRRRPSGQPATATWSTNRSWP